LSVAFHSCHKFGWTTVEIRDDLKIRFERLNKKENENESEVVEDLAKGKCRNCGFIGHKAQGYKNKTQQNRGNYGNSQNGTTALIVADQAIWRGNVLNWKTKQVTITLHGVTMGIMATITGEILVLLISLLCSYKTHETSKRHLDMGQWCLWTLLLICVRVKECQGHKWASNDWKRTYNGGKKLGDLKCEVTQVNGSKFEVTLKEVKYIPESWAISFSINKECKDGFELRNDRDSIQLAKDPVSLCFDCIIPTANGIVTGVKMNVMHPENTFHDIVNATIKKHLI
jgi:hypothetical protein